MAILSSIKLALALSILATGIFAAPIDLANSLDESDAFSAAQDKLPKGQDMADSIVREFTNDEYTSCADVKKQSMCGNKYAKQACAMSCADEGHVDELTRTTKPPRGRRCFDGASRVTLADGTTTEIESIKAGDKVMGWSNAADVAAGEPARPLAVVKARASKYTGAPLHGLQMKLLAWTGATIHLAPFATPNHPFLSKAGTWHAADPKLSNDELEAYFATLADPNVTATVGPITPSKTELMVALSTGTSILAAPATVEALVGKNEDAKVAKEAKVVEEEEIEATVYSLELDSADHLAVYIVNGVLVMD